MGKSKPIKLEFHEYIYIIFLFANRIGFDTRNAVIINDPYHIKLSLNSKETTHGFQVETFDHITTIPQVYEPFPARIFTENKIQFLMIPQKSPLPSIKLLQNLNEVEWKRYNNHEDMSIPSMVLLSTSTHFTIVSLLKYANISNKTQEDQREFYEMLYLKLKPYLKNESQLIESVSEHDLKSVHEFFKNMGIYVSIHPYDSNARSILELLYPRLYSNE